MAPRLPKAKPPPALRPKRAAFFVLLALVGLWAGAQLARLDRDARPAPRATPSVAWENGTVVIHEPAEQTAAAPDP